MPESSFRSQFEQQYEPVARVLFAWACLHIRSSLRPRLDPEDVLQEVCCRAFQRFAQFDPERASFRTWVFGIAHNVLREAFRGLGRSHAAALTTGRIESLQDLATSITRRVARDDELRNFLSRLDILTDEDRRLLLYRGLEGLEHARVAELLSITAESASKRWQRLCSRLRELGLPIELGVV